MEVSQISPLKNKAGGLVAGSPERVFPLHNPCKRPASAASSLPDLPDGWSSFTKTRKHGASANRKDICYTSPEGNVFPSLIHAKKYVGNLATEDKERAALHQLVACPILQIPCPSVAMRQVFSMWCLKQTRSISHFASDVRNYAFKPCQCS